MNPERKQQWVDALRSGDYKQGVGRLRTHTEQGALYCCLGVACELARQTGVVQFTAEGQYQAIEDPSYGMLDESSYTLPIAVMLWLGLEEVDPTVQVGEEAESSLSALNDNGVLFDEIAAFIEEQL